MVFFPVILVEAKKPAIGRHQHLHKNNEEFGIKTPINIDHLVCFEKN